MKVGIIGGGSIGLFISRFLMERHQVTIYVRREEQKRQLNNYGLQMKNEAKHFPVRALLLTEIEAEEALIICVKQQHVASVLPIIYESNAHTPLFFLQNGMGHIQKVKALKQPTYLGVVEHGALRLNDYTVQHTGQGIIKFANYYGGSADLEKFIMQLNQERFPVQIVGDWEQLLAEKLVINAVINPLTALFDVPNGMIIENEYVKEIAKMLCAEASKVLELDFDTSWDRVQAVALHTKENISSMLKDLRENRLTENEAISGYIINQHKANIPYTSFVYNGIKALEEKKGIRG